MVIALVASLGLASCTAATAANKAKPVPRVASPDGHPTPEVAVTSTDPRLTIASSTAMHRTSVMPPISTAPLGHHQDVTFLNGQTGFVISSVPANPEPLPGSPQGTAGIIQATADGGRTWRVAWRQDGTDLFTIAFAPDHRHGFVLGQRPAPAESFSGHKQAIVVSTADGGSSWSALDATVPDDLYALSSVRPKFATPLDGFAARDPAMDSAGARTIVTHDGGRTWARIDIPGADFVSAVGFSTTSIGYAAASPTKGDACAEPFGSSGLWRTVDGGKNWSRVPGFCLDTSLLDINFADAQHGLAVGGRSGYYSPALQKVAAPTRSVALRTSDGGLSWVWTFDRKSSNRADVATPGIGLAAPVTGGVAWAIREGCYSTKAGQSHEFPCGGAVLRTADGGRSWADVGVMAYRLSAMSSTHAWIVDLRGHLLNSSDAGVTWTLVARPDAIDPGGVVATDGRLSLTTAAGAFASDDLGASWHRLMGSTPLRDSVTGIPQTRSARVETPEGPVSGVGISLDGGRTWVDHEVVFAYAGVEVWSSAFVDAQHGFAIGQALGQHKGAPVSTTSDGGLTWIPSDTPGLDIDSVDVTTPAIIGGVAILTGSRARGRPGTGRDVVIGTTHDLGRTWTSAVVPNAGSCGRTVASGTRVWVSCDAPGPSLGTFVAFVLVSDDRGVTWQRLDAPEFDVSKIVPVSSSVAIADDGGGAVWRTVDGGLTWSPVWVADSRMIARPRVAADFAGTR